MVPSSTPRGRTQTIYVFPLGSNNENEFIILSPFHTSRVLRNTFVGAKSEQQVNICSFAARCGRMWPSTQ